MLILSLMFASVSIIVIFLSSFVAASFGLSATPCNLGRPYAPTSFTTAKVVDFFCFSEPFGVEVAGYIQTCSLPLSFNWLHFAFHRSFF